MSAQQWREGLDGSMPSYSERLRTPWLVWCFATLLTITLGIAYGYAVGVLAGVATFLIAQAVALVVLLRTAPLLRVDSKVFRAGRARLPLQWVGRVRTLDPQTARRLRGVDADPQAYLCVRSWVAGAVLVEVTDPADPHPYWLVSTKQPERLAAALSASRTVASPDTSDTPLAG